MSHSTESLALSIARGSAAVALAAYGICLVQEGTNRFQDAATVRIEAWTEPVAAVEVPAIAEVNLSQGEQVEQVSVAATETLVAGPTTEDLPLDIGTIGFGSLAIAGISGAVHARSRRTARS